MNTHVRDQFDYLKASTANTVVIGGKLYFGSTTEVTATAQVIRHPFSPYHAIEYGTIAATSSGVTVSYNSTHFSTGYTPRVVVTPTGLFTAYVTAASASGFTVTLSSGSNTCNWLAMGVDANT